MVMLAWHTDKMCTLHKVTLCHVMSHDSVLLCFILPPTRWSLTRLACCAVVLLPCTCTQTSALDASGVDTAFQRILTEIYRLMSRKTIAANNATGPNLSQVTSHKPRWLDEAGSCSSLTFFIGRSDLLGIWGWNLEYSRGLIDRKYVGDRKYQW